MCMYAYISKQAGKTRGEKGGLGGCSLRKFRCSEIASGAIFGQKQSRSFIQFLVFLHAFAKPAGFKFPREKVLRLAEQ